MPIIAKKVVEIPAPNDTYEVFEIVNAESHDGKTVKIKKLVRTISRESVETEISILSSRLLSLKEDLALMDGIK